MTAVQKENAELNEKSKNQVKELQKTKKLLKDRELEMKKLKTDFTQVQENKQKTAEDSKEQEA